MELTHTHRTHQVRNDYELAAITLMGTWENKSVDDMEAIYRGMPVFEASVRKTANWLEEFSKGYTAIKHQCRGQLC